ncbi:MAG: hypothetical protein RLZZ253_2545, partial [Verrucomicrobiota bacterium]
SAEAAGMRFDDDGEGIEAGDVVRVPPVRVAFNC